MARKIVYVVKNLKKKKCQTCTKIHEYYSRGTERAPCGTPVGWSEEVAKWTAEADGLDVREAVVRAPDDTVIVLDDSARSLKQQGGAEVPPDQIHFGMTTV